MKDLAEVAADIQEQKDRIDTVDFKMVTFSLAGKAYGVDIMNVKEIAKADKFTYVPNAASYVKGVYNLRGDIIPIIDLRLFFHLPTEKKADGIENMLILRIQDRVYGTIVDKIDKVIGINTGNIQPPHPIFGDINIKFINGIVEKGGDLYVILDVIRIFTQNEEEKSKPRAVIQEDAAGQVFFAPPPPQEIPAEDKVAVSATTLEFIRESLPVLKRFYPSPVNDTWLHQRFAEWSASRQGDALQLRNSSEAEEFLSSFPSPDTGRFWSTDYAELVKGFLPDLSSNNIQVWDIGCGKGYETFSFACILKARYPSGHIKIWANDNDIMAISQAPNMIFELDEIPGYCRNWTSKGRNGFSFNQAIKDSIVFEYHDVLNENSLPDLDIILVRDILSFVPVDAQQRIAAGFAERLKKRGIVFLGRNEVMPGEGWQSLGKDPVSAFVRVSNE